MKYKMLNYKSLMQEVRIGFDSGDPWGSAMSVFFSVADEIRLTVEVIIKIHMLHPR